MNEKLFREIMEINPIYARPGENTEAPRFKMPTDAMLPETAYQIVHDESMMDGNARLNLATFVSTWMDERADKLYLEIKNVGRPLLVRLSSISSITAYASSLYAVFVIVINNTSELT